MAFCFYCMNSRVEEGAAQCPECGREIPLVLKGDEVVPRALLPGTVLKNRYILGRPLGAGGFAVTYLAWDKELYIVRAVKEFFPMNLMQKLSLQKEYVDNWKQLVESIMIDWNYDGVVMEPTTIDIAPKDGFVEGVYTVPADAGRIKVKITDLLSESLEIEVG